jgi:hypothetical protein
MLDLVNGLGRVQGTSLSTDTRRDAVSNQPRSVIAGHWISNTDDE